MSSEMQNNLIKQIMQVCLDRTGPKVMFDLKVKQICDLRVFVQFNVMWPISEPCPLHMYLTIKSAEIYDDDGDFMTLFYADLTPDKNKPALLNISNGLQQIAEILNKLVFDKMSGCFVNPDNTKIIPHLYSFCEAFEVSSPSVKPYAEACCVCYDKTVTTTSCQHVLCVPCWDLIKETPDEDDELHRRCPICRQALFM